jgi:hypothetical protein
LYCFNISENQDTSSYIKKVQFLLMYMFQREQIFSMTDVAKYTVQTADNMNVVKNQLFFWTNHQKTIIDSDEKRVLFTSEFGTGKTTLLKAKATQLGKERRNHHLKNKTNQNDSSARQVFFVVFTGQEALLTQSLKLDLEELKEHVKIVSMTSKLISSKLITLKVNYIKS